MKLILFICSVCFLGCGVYFTLCNNLFLAIVAIITSSFFSSTSKHIELKSEIKKLKKVLIDKNILNE